MIYIWHSSYGLPADVKVDFSRGYQHGYFGVTHHRWLEMFTFCLFLNISPVHLALPVERIVIAHKSLFFFFFPRHQLFLLFSTKRV